jgi:hypothetical protein
MFRFTQEPSSGSYFVLSLNYIVLGTRWKKELNPVPSSTVYSTLAHRLVGRHDIDNVINDEHNRIIIIVLAEHKIAPWWWFLREPKHVGAIVGILIVFNFFIIL